VTGTPVSAQGPEPAAPADAIAAAHPDLLVSTAWLAAHRDDAGLRIVDCRYNFNPGPSGYEQYLQGHVPGAVYLDLERDISTPADEEPRGVPWMIAGSAQFAAAMAARGIGDDTLVVAYDDEGGHYAARLWWAMAYYGHDTCRILSGGLTAWLAEGRPLEQGEPHPPAAAFSPRGPRAELRATAGEVLAALGDPSVALVDVRRPTEYSGEEVRAARGGHIPGAIPLFWRDNLNWEEDAGGAASGLGRGRTWRAEDELRARHRAAGITPDRRVVTYCQLGVRASHAAFTLRLLGYPDVAVYDGSWYDWAARPDTPIEP
jgi:thiosulfate/3-mercaptopyruvate sulfurtransferase